MIFSQVNQPAHVIVTARSTVEVRPTPILSLVETYRAPCGLHSESLWSKECGQEHCEPHPLLSAIRIYEGVAHHKAAPTEQTIQALSAQRTLRVLSLRACVNISDDSIEELTVACPGLSTLDLAHLPGITVRV